MGTTKWAVSFPSELAERVEALAAERGISRSALLQEAARAYVEPVAGPPGSVLAFGADEAAAAPLPSLRAQAPAVFPRPLPGDTLPPPAAQRVRCRECGWVLPAHAEGCRQKGR